MSMYAATQAELTSRPHKWAVTGVAGFIGSNILEKLLSLDQEVVGLDNFATGKSSNLDEVRSFVSPRQWAKFRFIKGDITALADCQNACTGAEFVLHQAALGSVSRSIEDPIRSHASNVDGFINMLVAARDARVSRFVYASSSSVYGDHPALPKVEEVIGRPLSLYAATKLTNEIYADVFCRTYGFSTVGLRYFNVFGRRQDPAGPYAAVIPIWFTSMLQGLPTYINGDGETSRDFCYIDNAVQANILAAISSGRPQGALVVNVACGERTSLRMLFDRIAAVLGATQPGFVAPPVPIIRPPRVGDVRHSLADISLARKLLGYEPAFSLDAGLRQAASWYIKKAKA